MTMTAASWGELTTLRTLGEALADAIKARVATDNRVKRGGAAVDEVAGKVMLQAARNLEDLYRKELVAEYRSVVPAPIREWAAGIPGLASGELFPRIISILGHPRIATPYAWPEGARTPVPAGEPYERSLRQLWQYAGCGDPASVPVKAVLGRTPTRQDMLHAGKRTVLRPLLYTFSSSLVLAGTPVTKEGSRLYGRPRSQAAHDSEFYQIFAAAKAEGAGRVHTRQCQNRKRPPMSPNGCGTVQHPEWGEPGSPWRPGHAQAHAHRVVHKEFLRQLWRVAGGE